MKLLLDSHFCFWLTVRTDILLEGERRIIDSATELAYSAASIWELRLKWDKRHSSGERKGPVDPLQLLEALSMWGLRELPVTGALAAAALAAPVDHSDPFDVLLLVQAQQGGYRLLTRDDKLASHPVALVLA